TALAAEAPFADDLRRRLGDGAARAERGQAAAELHHLCERLRPLYGADFLSDEEAAAAEARCRELWDRREAIARRVGPASEWDGPMRTDLVDAAVLLAHLEGRRGAREEALAVLSQAEALLGPSCVLCQEGRTHALALGRRGLAEECAQRTEALPPRDGWEHYAL